ncbi:hypothetical protein [Rhizobium sp. SL86]|uniref:hypothetical protein n=1 Tax=Rhizobium sp. SL86 TaxID=2995148 RepID=UPI0022749A1E|nr:hypothetical protein [Rhizobium sp. SL86]MCY1664590.1 hypothetical protein [Rhizobium sp. SL86]
MFNTPSEAGCANGASHQDKTAKELLDAAYLDLRRVLAVTRLATVALQDLDERVSVDVETFKLRARDVIEVLEGIEAPLEKAMTGIDEACLALPDSGAEGAAS